MRDLSSVYPDEYIDYWGDVFLALDLAREGIEFEGFLQSPQSVLLELGVRPLLAEQAEAAARGLTQDGNHYAGSNAPPEGGRSGKELACKGSI